MTRFHTTDANIIMSTGGKDGDNVSAWQTIVTLLTGGGIAALAAVALKVLEYFRKNKLTDEDRKLVAQKEAREEAKSEFDQMLAEYKGRVAELVKQLNDLRVVSEARYESQRKFWDDKFQEISSQHDAEISAIRRESADQINRLRDDAYRARIESEKLRGYVQMLQVTNAQLRAGSPLGGMEQLPEGNITIDQDGRIRQVDGTFLQMVRYESERELVGRPVSILVPPERRADHEASLKKIRDTGSFPDPKSIIYTDIYTRDSMRVPVSAQFAAWKGSDGRLIFHVTVRERFDESAPSLQEMTAVPEFVPPPVPPPAATPKPPESPDVPQK